MNARGAAVGRVDVVDDVLAVGPALRAAATRLHVPIQVRAVASSWVEYASTIADVAPVVIVRAELVDHVPTLLKVRALRAAGARPVVVSDDPTPVHQARLRAEGAVAVLTRENDLQDLIAALRGHEPPLASVPELPAEHLSDRQLQLSCLYCAPGAPSAEHLARWLGLPISSVRTNLQRARRALGAADRRELRTRLIEGGWMDAPALKSALNGIAAAPPRRE